jgi:hypothetical protein
MTILRTAAGIEWATAFGLTPALRAKRSTRAVGSSRTKGPGGSNVARSDNGD